MIDACSPLNRFTENLAGFDVTTPILWWDEAWRLSAGYGIGVGLLDTGFDTQIPDLEGAELTARDFTCSKKTNSNTIEHGTHSVATLVGQGRHQIRGIIPQARLLVAEVAGPEGIAKPPSVVEAIDWLISSGAQIIVLPLGDTIEHWAVSQQIEKGSNCGVIFFAAAGNSFPDPVLFPAKHPLVIAVGATDLKGNLLPECSRLPRLDLLAPGLNIPAPIGGQAVRRRRGTSVACVIAAGVAALAFSAEVFLPNAMNRTSALAALCREQNKQGKEVF